MISDPFSEPCAICPRECGADRRAGELGYCRSGQGLHVASICLHRGEEPVLGGERGICNVFFSRCNMRCVYCQNWQISRNREAVLGREVALGEALERIESLLDEGARHVGFVSPSHVVPQMVSLIEALSRRRPRPVVVMNTNAYDKPETLRALEGLVDVYLPDFKYMEADLAARLSDAPDYPAVAARSLREMHRQKGARLQLDGGGMATSGLIVRHLVLPGGVENSKRCLRFVAEELSPSVYLSLLAQYQPTPEVAADPFLGRRLTREEYEEVRGEMESLGFRNGWTQPLDSAERYNPDFRARHPFES